MNLKIKNAWAVLPVSDGFSVRQTDILVKNDKIFSVSPDEKFSADKTIDGSGKLVLPGLVNTHTHAYMSLFKNYADDLSFDEWLFGKIEPLENKLQSEDAYWTAQLAIAEMLRSGTTCFCDMHMFPHQSAKAAAETGIRAVISRGLVGQTRNDEGGLRRIREALEEYNEWKDKADGRLSFMLAPHAPYSCAPDFIETVAEEAERQDLGIHVHLAESANEFENIKKQYGKTPIELMDSLGLFKRRTLAAHCVQLTDNDIEILSERSVFVALNPVSNLKLKNGIAPVNKLLKKGVKLSLGTDGSASNNSLNMFKEMAFINLLSDMDAPTTLKTATQSGAKALGLEKEIGSIAPGMKADLILIDLNKPHFQPRSHLIAAMSYTAQGSDVETVIVNGSVLMENYELKTIDTEKLYFQIDKITARLGMTADGQ